MKYELPKLQYEYSALEPHIDANTMQIHYEKHHQAYITNLNSALEQTPEIADWSLEDLLSKINEVPESVRTAVRNNGGGHFNHTLFWYVMTPNANEPSQKLLDQIEKDLGGLEAFKTSFKDAAMKRFGSGWSWLVIDSNGVLSVVSTPNQDNPLMDGKNPILGIDVWEHAYYLNYQNRRADYIDSWWNVVNWEAIENNIASYSN